MVIDPPPLGVDPLVEQAVAVDEARAAVQQIFLAAVAREGDVDPLVEVGVVDDSNEALEAAAFGLLPSMISIQADSRFYNGEEGVIIQG